MDVFKKNEEAFNRSNQILYNNNQPVQERKKRRTVLLDIDDSGLYAKPGNWEALLYEPLIINNNSDVYLDTLITYSGNLSNTANGVNAGFLLGINEQIAGLSIPFIIPKINLDKIIIAAVFPEDTKPEF